MFLRNLHRWAAHLMVFAAFLHMLRVFYHRAYRPPRQFNWVVGVVLLIVTLLLSYTGYLLPWDQLAFWGVSVGTNMAKEAPLIGEQVRFLLLGRPRRVGERAPSLLRPALRRAARRAAAAPLRPHLAGAQGRRSPGAAGGAGRSRSEESFHEQPAADLQVVESTDPLATPRRVALVRPDIRPAVRRREERWVMTFPHLIVREVILFQVVVIVLALAAIAFRRARCRESPTRSRRPTRRRPPGTSSAFRSCCTTSRPSSPASCCRRSSSSRSP